MQTKTPIPPKIRRTCTGKHHKQNILFCGTWQQSTHTEATWHLIWTNLRNILSAIVFIGGCFHPHSDRGCNTQHCTENLISAQLNRVSLGNNCSQIGVKSSSTAVVHAKPRLYDPSAHGIHMNITRFNWTWRPSGERHCTGWAYKNNQNKAGSQTRRKKLCRNGPGPN